MEITINHYDKESHVTIEEDCCLQEVMGGIIGALISVGWSRGMFDNYFDFIEMDLDSKKIKDVVEETINENEDNDIHEIVERAVSKILYV